MVNIFLAIILFPGLAHSSAKIEFHSVVGKSTSKNLYLKDIAKFVNVDPVLASSLEKLVIDEYPKANSKKTYSSKYISGILRSQGGLLKSNKIKLVIPNKIEVENKFRLSKSQIRREVISLLENNCNKCKVEISKLVLPIVANHDKIESWEIKDTQTKPRGHFMLPLKVNFKKHSRVFWVKGVVKIFKKVPVVNQPLYVGNRIHISNVSMKYKDITYSAQPEMNMDFIIGKKLNRNLRDGQVLLKAYLSNEKALKRGDMVSVSLGKKSWSISLKAKAEQGGVIGDRVSIRNIKSNKLMTAIITGVGEVTLE